MRREDVTADRADKEDERDRHTDRIHPRRPRGQCGECCQDQGREGVHQCGPVCDIDVDMRLPIRRCHHLLVLPHAQEHRPGEQDAGGDDRRDGHAVEGVDEDAAESEDIGAAFVKAVGSGQGFGSIKHTVPFKKRGIVTDNDVIATGRDGVGVAQPTYDAIVVGAGFGGIGAAIELKRQGVQSIAIVEREDDLGGTWHVNHYPGLAVDIASVTYSYSFEPNPFWSRLFAPGAELKRYAEHVADKYDLRRHMVFGEQIERAEWDDSASFWRVYSEDGTSGLPGSCLPPPGSCRSRTPAIPGIKTFKGTVIHTTAWQDGHDFTGERVAVIGTGATAVQLIPRSPNAGR